MFTRIHQKQSKQQCYEKFEAALKVERTVLVLTQGRPDSKRGAPSTSQPDPSQSSRKKGKKWTGGRGSGRGAASSQGFVLSPVALGGGSTAPGRGCGMGAEGRGSTPIGQIQSGTRTQAWVFTVTQQEVDASPDMITGMILVYDHDAYALVDPGATHSFISVSFTERHQIESQPIDGRMVVSVPNGDTMISERIVPSSGLVIQNKDFPTDLIVLGIHDFDIVFSMDWLSKHRATLDFYKKEVRLVRPEEPGLIFRGIRREIALVSLMP